MPAKPLLGLLVGSVVFFALWMVALKPSSSTSGGSPSGLGQYQSAINKAHQAVTTSNAANAKLGAPVSTAKSPTPSTTKSAAAPKPSAKAAVTKTPATKTPAATKATATRATATKATATKAQPAPVPVATELKNLQSAISAHDVVVVLFYNGAAADDKAMAKELAAVPVRGGSVVKLSVPVAELAQFEAITAQIPVVTAPTLVVIDPTRQATLLTGFVSQMELNQRVTDALAVK